MLYTQSVTFLYRYCRAFFSLCLKIGIPVVIPHSSRIYPVMQCTFKRFKKFLVSEGSLFLKKFCNICRQWIHILLYFCLIYLFFLQSLIHNSFDIFMYEIFLTLQDIGSSTEHSHLLVPAEIYPGVLCYENPFNASLQGINMCSDFEFDFKLFIFFTTDGVVLHRH